MCTLATLKTIAPPLSDGPPLDGVMLFGFMVSFLTLVLWMYQGQSRAAALALALCVAALAIYAFLKGAGPLGIVEGVWAVAAVNRLRKRKNIRVRTLKRLPRDYEDSLQFGNYPSRISRMFGPR